MIGKLISLVGIVVLLYFVAYVLAFAGTILGWPNWLTTILAFGAGFYLPRKVWNWLYSNEVAN